MINTVEKQHQKRGLRMILMGLSLFFTVWGVVMLIQGQITNGLLALVVGELIDMPKYRDFKEGK